MKKQLAFGASAIVLAACSSVEEIKPDEIDGHARIIRNTPTVVAPAYTPVVPPAPAVVHQQQPAAPVAPQPKPRYIAPPLPPTPPAVTRTQATPQPVVTPPAPRPVPAARGVSQNQPTITTPPAPRPARRTRAASQNQPVVNEHASGSLPAVSESLVDHRATQPQKPMVQPKPKPAPVATPSMQQRQPNVSAPGRNTRDYPIMPGQNRGLRARGSR